MRRLTPWILLLLLAMALALPARAEQTGEEELDRLLEEQMEASGAGELEEAAPLAAREILDELEIGLEDWRSLLELTPRDLCKALGEIAAQRVGAPLRLLGILLGVVLLCAFVDGLKLSFGSRDLDLVFHAVAVLCVTGAVLRPVLLCVEQAAAAIEECSRFMTAFVPVFSGVVAAGG
ncbi:MAG: hypothetical protein PHD67_02755 [Oscillospiraceae bacterium]|nr:hypothetical protein [Oscillospiraceae bacterium]